MADTSTVFNYSHAEMDGENATLWIFSGAGAAAVGLYIVIRAAAANGAAVRWVGWSLYVLGGGVVGGTVLESTGSFWNLLLFGVLSAGALLCVTVTALSGPRDTAPGPTDMQLGWTGQHVETTSFLGAVAAVVAILVLQGQFWIGGALVMAILILVLMLIGPYRADIAAWQFDALTDGGDSFREPALGCLMWGLLTSGLMTALQHGRVKTAVESAVVQTAQFNNVIALACGMLSLGVLQAVARRRFRSRLCGTITLLMAALLVCSTGPDRRQSELLGLVVLACGVVSTGFLISTVRLRPSAMASECRTAKGDA